MILLLGIGHGVRRHTQSLSVLLLHLLLHDTPSELVNLRRLLNSLQLFSAIVCIGPTLLAGFLDALEDDLLRLWA